MYCGEFRLDPQWLKVNSETKSNSVNAPHSDEDRRYQVVLDTQVLPIQEGLNNKHNGCNRQNDDQHGVDFEQKVVQVHSPPPFLWCLVAIPHSM